MRNLLVTVISNTTPLINFAAINQLIPALVGSQTLVWNGRNTHQILEKS